MSSTGFSPTFHMLNWIQSQIPSWVQLDSIPPSIMGGSGQGLLSWKQKHDNKPNCTILYCIYYTVLYGTVLYYMLLYSTVCYDTVQYCIVWCFTVMYCIALYNTVLYATVQFCMVWCCTLMYFNILYGTIQYCTLICCRGFQWACIGFCLIWAIFIHLLGVIPRRVPCYQSSDLTFQCHNWLKLSPVASWISVRYSIWLTLSQQAGPWTLVTRGHR